MPVTVVVVCRGGAFARAIATILPLGHGFVASRATPFLRKLASGSSWRRAEAYECRTRVSGLVQFPYLFLARSSKTVEMYTIGDTTMDVKPPIAIDGGSGIEKAVCIHHPCLRCFEREAHSNVSRYSSCLSNVHYLL